MMAFDKVAGRDAFFVPAMPSGASAAALSASASYFEAFDRNGDDCDVYWDEAAKAVAEIQPSNMADVAVKMLVGLHFAGPSFVDNRPAVLNNFEHEIAGDIILGAVSDLLAMASIETEQMGPSPELGAARWDALKAEFERLLFEFEQDESKEADDHCDAMDALLTEPAPDSAAVRFKIELMKRRWADFQTPDEAWDQLSSDIKRLEALQ